MLTSVFHHQKLAEFTSLISDNLYIQNIWVPIINVDLFVCPASFRTALQAGVHCRAERRWKI